jgi:Na+/H+ antiporter NhaC
LIAFIGSIALLLYQNSLITNIAHLDNLPAINFIDIIKTLPFWLTFYLAFTKLDFIIIMGLGIILTLSIGLLLNDITPLRAINILFDGFYHSKDTVNIFVLIFLLSGLSTIVIYNGGIEYLINSLQHKISNAAYSKFLNSCLITLINICISLIVAGQISKKRGRNYDIAPKETFYIPDIQPFVLQGILPYMPQLILAASMASVPMISLIPYLYYQILLGASVLLGTMLYNNLSIHENKFL